MDEREPASPVTLPVQSVQTLYHLADELRGIARLGLMYAQNEHDCDRYERVLAAAARLVATIDVREHDDETR